MTGKSPNQVTLFSNGMGHFRRTYEVEVPKTEVSIPFKRNHIGDVLASLTVFGDVRLLSPPTFSPVSEEGGSLQINSKDSVYNMLADLSGAEVEVTSCAISGPNKKTHKGTILGITVAERVEEGASYHQRFLSLWMGGKMVSVSFRDIQNIVFLDETVKSEIEKALKTNFQRIKPDSTFIDISLAPLNLDGELVSEPTSAIINYTIPVAAWKMRYNIRQNQGRYQLEGTAIIDNNTDEDWDDFLVSVVTGNPVSFSSDLANVVTPARAFVSVVEGGNLQAPDLNNVATASLGMYGAMGGRGVRAQAANAKSYTRMVTANSGSNYGDFGDEDAEEEAGLESVQAAAPGVDTKEVGDFSIFTAKERMSIKAKRSAVVPMFTVPLVGASSILCYSESKHPRRPWLAVKFKNESTHSLGRGKVIVYQDGEFQGEAVMDAAKPGEVRMLPHRLENGVRIVKERGETNTCRSSIRVSEGVAVDEVLYTSETTYTIENRKEEEFRFLVEHTRNLHGKDTKFRYSGVEVAETEKIDGGVRVYFVLKSKEKVVLKVTEELLEAVTVRLGGMVEWFAENIVETNHPLSKDKNLVACMAVQKKIDELESEIRQKNSEVKSLEAQAERVRQNLGAVKGQTTSGIEQTWVADLHQTESEIRKITHDTVPALTTERKQLRTKLKGALEKLSLTWKS
jgi:cell division protein FtsB